MRVEIRESEIEGKGCFAVDRIEEGDRDLITGLLYFPAPDMERYCFEVEGDLAFLPDEPWLRLNHSADPNCVVWEDNTIEALRTIGAGEEILIDYGYNPGE